MTVEEARALFPVLERIAYLNAGTFGPLARPVAAALAAGLERDLHEGRSGRPYFEATMELRDEVRGALADLFGAERDQVALNLGRWVPRSRSGQSRRLLRRHLP